MSNNGENMNPLTDVLRIDAPAFRAEVLDSKQPVLVHFSAPWSRPCQLMDSVLRDLATALVGKIKVVKVNADESLDLSLWYEISSVPTIVFFVQGVPRSRIVGTATKEAILAKLQSFSKEPLCIHY